MRVLIKDAGDLLRLAEGAIGEAHATRFVELAFGGGDGVAMGIGRGVAQEGIDALEDAIGDGVLQGVGFFVDDGPVETKDADEEEFHEAMAAEDVEGELLAAVGEADAAARFVLDQAGIGQGFDHRGGGAGDDAHDRSQAAHGHHLAIPAALLQINLLEVIFDGAGGHGWDPPANHSKGYSQNDRLTNVDG